MQPEQGLQARLPVSARRARDISPYAPVSESDRPGPNILAIVWRRRWIVFGCVAVSLVAGAIYLKRATRIYSSSSVLYVQAAVPKVVSDELSTESSSGNYLLTQCQIIQSPVVLGGALDVPGVSDARTLRNAENPIGLLKYMVTAEPSKQGDLVVVSAQSTSPEDAAIVANGVVQSYIDYQSKLHQSTAVEVLNILKGEMDRHDADLKADQAKMLDLTRADPDLAFRTEKGSLAITRLASLTDALEQAKLRALDLKTAVAAANAAQDDPAELRRIISQFQLDNEVPQEADPQLSADYHQAKLELDDLLDRLGARNDQVLHVQRELSRLQAELAASTQRMAETSRAVLQYAMRAANDRVNELQSAVDQERSATLKLTTKAAEYDQLAEDAARIGRAIDQLDSRLKEINVNEDVGSLTVAVLETAKPSVDPVRPKGSQALGMALVAGLMVGVGVAMLRDLTDQRLRSAEEITQALDLPILGAVPHILGKTASADRGQEVHQRPRSDVAEAYRSIRTAIYFGLSADEQVVRTILVTSPAPGDGKSTSISNMAIAIAQAGRRVLIVDADCRRPTQHRIFKITDSGPGLSTILAGQANLDAAIRKTSVERLDVLPCGPLPHNPAELLDSQALLDLLKEVSSRYDQVLIDSPPVVPVTDARILSASCDATVLVLRADRSTRRLAEHARDGLLSVGANLLGLVLNDVPRGKGAYGYYYYGYGRYSSYSSNGGSNGASNGASNGKSNGNGDRHHAPASLIVAEGTIQT
jgi:succinoglycan biosynthesis transport protein ExoP